MPNIYSITMKRIHWYLFLFIGIAIIFLITRILFFNITINKLEKRLQDKIGASLTYDSYQFKGLTGVEFKKIMIKNTDTIFYADTFRVKVTIFSMFKSGKKLKEIKLTNSKIILTNQIINDLFKTGKSSSTAINNPVNYSQKANHYINLIFESIPEKITLHNINLKYSDSSYILTTQVSHLQLKNNKLIGVLIFNDLDKINKTFNIKGNFDYKRKNISFEVEGNKSQLATLPFISYKWNLDFKFSNLKVDFKVNQLSDQIKLNFACWFDSLFVAHPKLSDDMVFFHNLGLQLNSNITKKYVELDSTSLLSFNHFSFSPYFQFKNDTFRQLTIKIPFQEFDASTFFDALPPLMFKNISGIKVRGKLSYQLSFRINLDSLENVSLNAQLKGHDFRILQYGRARLSMLNDTFHIFRHDPGFDPVYIKVDSNHSSYTRLSEISKFLIYSVLTSEDGSFFYHRGFNEEAIANSIAENIKKKRFARGGSTITMQLVKNVFLTRKKTISRKLEELLLTWLLENSGIISKEKMLEIYFNIIEWGPNIYGIHKASQYYFNKKPSQLNLKESIFLTSIIPSPKYFRYTFEHNGKLKESYRNYFQRIASIMLSRNQVSMADTVGLNIQIELSGKAKEQLIKQFPLDNLVDSTYLEEPEDY